MPTTVFSYKIPYHSIKPQQHKHIFQLRSRDKDDQKDQDPKKDQDVKNRVFVLSFLVCQERDNYDGILPLFFLFPFLIFLPKQQYKKFEKWIVSLYLRFAIIEWRPKTLYFRLRKTEWRPKTLYFRLRKTEWRLKIPYFRLRKTEWCLKIPYFRHRKIKWYTKIPYLAFYFGNYIPLPGEANQKLYEGVQLIKGTACSILHHPRIENILEEITKDMSEMEMEKRESQINDEQSIDRIDASLGKLQSRIKEFTDNEDKRVVGFSADFELERQGIIEMDNFQCSASVQKDLEDDPDKKDPPKYYANQLFYFIKDIFHTHSHHSDTDDYLSSLHPMPDDSSDLKHKLGCLRRVFQKLTRRYLQIESESAGRKHLLGFLAYIHSLQILMNKLGKSLLKEDFEPLDLNYPIMRESVEAAIEKEDAENQKKLIRRQWVYGMLTAGLLLWAQISDKPGLSGMIEVFFRSLFPDADSSFIIALIFWGCWIVIGYMFIFGGYRPMRDKLGQALQEAIYWIRAFFQGYWKWIGRIVVGAIWITWVLFCLWFWTVLSFWVWIPLLFVFICVLILSLFFYLKVDPDLK